MQFTQVNKEDIPQTRTREGKVSTALIKAFLDSEIDLAQVDTSGQDKKMESVRSTIANYVKRHELAVKVFTAGGNLYLERSEEAKAKYVKENAEAKAKEASNGQTAPAPAADATASAPAEAPANA